MSRAYYSFLKGGHVTKGAPPKCHLLDLDMLNSFLNERIHHETVEIGNFMMKPVVPGVQTTYFFLSPSVPGGSPLSSDPTKGKVNVTKSYQICRMPFAARRDWNFARHIYIYICFFVGYHKRFVGQELLPSSHFSMNCISLTVPFSGCSLRIRMLHIIGNYTQASTELPCFFRPSFFWWKL